MLKLFRFVRDRFDAVLQRQHFVIAGYHGDCPELEPFCEVHGAENQARGDASHVHEGSPRAGCLPAVCRRCCWCGT